MIHLDLIALNNVPQIFVGRQPLMVDLQELLNNIAMNGRADFVRVLLNTPGIGKTKAIEHFGTALMACRPFSVLSNENTPKAQYGLYVLVTITRDQSIEVIFQQIIRETLKQLKNFYSTQTVFIPKMWSIKIPEGRIFADLSIEELFRIIEPLSEPALLFRNPELLLGTISTEIPIILHIDEFQESIHDTDKRIYNNLGTFLSGILKAPILSILTGTAFTIMNTIGSDRISPLNGKVKPLVLPFLPLEDQKAYVKYVILSCQNEQESQLAKYFENWLIFNSGGHPRTMEYMTTSFLTLLSNWKAQLFQSTVNFESHIAEFFKDLDRSVMAALDGIYWKSKYQGIIAHAIRNIPEALQHRFFMYLGDILASTNYFPNLLINFHQEFEGEIEPSILDEFLSIFIQMGYLVVNGHDNVYIASRYALQAFLKDWRKMLPNYYQILQEFIKNPVITEIMLHSPQSFGWTFEIFVKYCIFSFVNDSTKNFPFDYSFRYGIEKDVPFQVPTRYENYPGNLTLENLQSMPEITYIVFSTAESVDAVIKQENRFLFIQITSVKSPKIGKKLTDFLQFCQNMQKNMQKTTDKQIIVIPWIISLHPIDIDENLKHAKCLITHGQFWDAFFKLTSR